MFLYQKGIVLGCAVVLVTALSPSPSLAQSLFGAESSGLPH